MFLFILAIILAVIAVIAIIVATFSKDLRFGSIVVTVIAVIAAAVSIFFATFYANGVGEAKVKVNSVDRQVVGTVEEPGSGFRAPWEDFVDFDLFSQELVFAGNDGGAPSYTGGTVNGREITVSVGGVSGGSTQAQVDMTFVYSIDADAIEDLYSEYRSQERFTEQIVTRQVLSISRQVPSEYSAIEFRGSKRGEAETRILDALNEKLGKYGVEFSAVTIQDVRFSEDVEKSLTSIEQANQKAQEAEANQRTKEVENETLIASAQAEADANRILSESLSGPVLQQRYLDTLAKLAKEGNLVVVPEGFNGLVNVTK